MTAFRSFILMLVLAAAYAGDAPDPAATVGSWIKAMQANDLTTAWDALPEAQRKVWSAALSQPTSPAPAEGAPGTDRQRGGPRGGRTLDMPLRMLAEGDQAAQGGRILAATLAAMAGTVSLDGKAPASVQLPTDQPFLAFVPRMAAGGMLIGIMSGILAQGQESRQIAAIDTWSKGFATWAATAPLTDEQRAAAAQPHLQAFAVAVRAATAAKPDAPSAVDPSRTLLAAWSAGLPRLKQALAVYGLDADAAFASAKVVAEPANADGTITVVVRFTAFAAEQTLPLKLKLVDGGWEVSADSPALRWMRGAMGGMVGGRGGPGGFGGGGMRRRPDAPADANAPPADAPRPGGPVGF